VVTQLGYQGGAWISVKAKLSRKKTCLSKSHKCRIIVSEGGCRDYSVSKSKNEDFIKVSDLEW
jgi:hypothetical protein